MRTRIELLIATLLLVGIGVLAQSLKEARETRLRARLDSAKVQVRVDSVYVTRRVESVRTLRDTLLTRLTDTLLVKEYVDRVDTLVKSCLDCTRSASVAVHTADTLLRITKPRFRDRFGVTAGYGVTASGGVARAGPQVGVSFRVWP